MIQRERLVIYLAGLFLCAAAFGYTYIRHGTVARPPVEPNPDWNR